MGGSERERERGEGGGIKGKRKRGGNGEKGRNHHPTYFTVLALSGQMNGLVVIL